MDEARIKIFHELAVRSGQWQGNVSFCEPLGLGDNGLLFLTSLFNAPQKITETPQGELATKILTAVHIDPSTSCLLAVNTKAEPVIEELIYLRNFIESFVALINPKIIVASGELALKLLLYQSLDLRAFHGTWHQYRGVPLMPIFHLDRVLENPSNRTTGPKFFLWKDMEQVSERLANS